MGTLLFGILHLLEKWLNNLEMPQNHYVFCSHNGGFSIVRASTGIQQVAGHLNDEVLLLLQDKGMKAQAPHCFCRAKSVGNMKTIKTRQKRRKKTTLKRAKSVSEAYELVCY